MAIIFLRDGPRVRNYTKHKMQMCDSKISNDIRVSIALEKN